MQASLDIFRRIRASIVVLASLHGAAVAASIQGIQIKAGAPLDPARKPALAPRQGQQAGHDQGRAALSLAELRERAKGKRGA